MSGQMHDPVRPWPFTGRLKSFEPGQNRLRLQSKGPSGTTGPQSPAKHSVPKAASGTEYLPTLPPHINDHTGDWQAIGSLLTDGKNQEMTLPNISPETAPPD
eukprot:EG_transcript_42224